MELPRAYETMVADALRTDRSLISEIVEQCGLVYDLTAAHSIEVDNFEPIKIDRTVRHLTPKTVEALSDIAPNTEYILAAGIYRLEAPLRLAPGSRLRGRASGRTRIHCTAETAAIAVENCDAVEIQDLCIEAPNATGIRIQAANDVHVHNVRFLNSGRYAVHIDDGCSRVTIRSCHILGTGYGGIMARGNITRLRILQNIIEEVYRRELDIGNYAAAIRIQALEHVRPEYDDGVTLPSRKPQKADLKNNGVFSHFIGKRRPRHIEVRDNDILRSRSQGIYLSGALLTQVTGNRIVDCDKEGMCVDHQSCFNMVERNYFAFCGGRLAQSIRELEFDHIAVTDIDPQKGVAAKLPAVSIDYSDMNWIQHNTIVDSYGGGIKTVRSACFNIIADNRLYHNNRGDNEQHVFAEIHIGNSSSEGTKKVEYRKIFDNREFGSSWNLIARNLITATDRGVRIRPTSRHNVLMKNRPFGAAQFDYYVENDTNFTVASDKNLVRLPASKWPPETNARI